MNKATMMALLTIGLSVGLVAWSDVPPTNPFDPTTPPSQRSGSRLVGQVRPPDGVAAGGRDSGASDFGPAGRNRRLGAARSH